jgi:hypothetical protein
VKKETKEERKRGRGKRKRAEKVDGGETVEPPNP